MSAYLTDIEQEIYDTYISTAKGIKDEDGMRMEIDTLKYEENDDMNRIKQKIKTINIILFIIRLYRIEQSTAVQKKRENQPRRFGSPRTSPILFNEGIPDDELKNKISLKISKFRDELSNKIEKPKKKRVDSNKLRRYAIRNSFKIRNKIAGRKKKTRKKSTKKIRLTVTDYKKILTFYKLSIPKTYKKIKKKAEKIISKKFCSCIKKVQEKFKKEGIAIGICTKSVVNGKGYKRGKFTCKKKRTIKLYKGGRKRRTKKNQSGGVDPPNTSKNIQNTMDELTTDNDGDDDDEIPPPIPTQNNESDDEQTDDDSYESDTSTSSSESSDYSELNEGMSAEYNIGDYVVLNEEDGLWRVDNYSFNENYNEFEYSLSSRDNPENTITAIEDQMNTPTGDFSLKPEHRMNDMERQNYFVFGEPAEGLNDIDDDTIWTLREIVSFLDENGANIPLYRLSYGETEIMIERLEHQLEPIVEGHPAFQQPQYGGKKTKKIRRKKKTKRKRKRKGTKKKRTRRKRGGLNWFFTRNSDDNNLNIVIANKPKRKSMYGEPHPWRKFLVLPQDNDDLDEINRIPDGFSISNPFPNPFLMFKGGGFEDDVRAALSETVIKGKKCLDIGTRDGLNCWMLVEKGADSVLGIDIENKNFKDHDKVKMEKKITLRKQNLFEMDENEKFDVITCFLWNFGFLQLDNFAEKVKSLLRKEGVFYLGLYDNIYVNGDEYTDSVPKRLEEYFKSSKKVYGPRNRQQIWEMRV